MIGFCHQEGKKKLNVASCQAARDVCKLGMQLRDFVDTGDKSDVHLMQNSPPFMS